MATCDEKHSLNRRLDEDTVSVGTTCPAPDDSITSNFFVDDVGSNHECEENANVNTWKTGSFWDDRQIQETSAPQDTTQSQDMPVWMAVPAVPVPMVPIVACNLEMEPARIEAQFVQQAKDLTTLADQLEAEAWKLKNSSMSVNTVWTTVMLRNIPNNITRADLFDRFVCSGFADSFDFLYLPMDFKRDANLGYAFVNLVSPQEANRFFDFFQGFEDWGLASHKVCEVCWGNPLQGLDQHIDRYRNSPVMHNSVPDEHKPILLQDGHRISFPAPTKRIRAPRVSDRG